MFTVSQLLTIPTAFLGTAGFAMIWNMKSEEIIWASLNGLLTWTTYLVVNTCGGSVFISSLIASAVAIWAAEILARFRKANATQFVVGGLISMVPGASLYYTILSVIRPLEQNTRFYAVGLVSTLFGIAAGICVASAVVYMLMKLRERA